MKLRLNKHLARPVIYIHGFGSKKKKLPIAILGIALFVVVPVVFFATSYLHKESVSATNFTWDGGGVDNLCSTKENWLGDVAPTSLDTAVFNATSSKLAQIDCALDGISLDGYAGIVELAQDVSINTFYQRTGTLDTLVSHTLTVNNGFTKLGGSFKHHLTLGGGTVYSDATAFGTTGGDLIISGSVTATSTINWAGDSITTNAGATLDLGAYDFYIDSATKTLTNNGALIGTTGTWTITGDFTNNGYMAGTGTWEMRSSYTGTAASTVSAPAVWKVNKNFINGGAITPNNGTIIIGYTIAGSITTTFDPGLSNLYNLHLMLYSGRNAHHYVNIARSFNVLGDLILGEESYSSDGECYVNNPGTAMTINVSGSFVGQYMLSLGGPNLTVDMVGTSKTFSNSGITFLSNLILSGSNTSISNVAGPYFGFPGVTLTITGTGNTVTATSDIYTHFSNINITAGNTLNMGPYNLTLTDTYDGGTYTINNDGNMIGTTGTWDIRGHYIGSATSTVSAPANWDVERNFSNTGSITHNSGTLTFGDGRYSGSPTYTIDPGSSDLYNLVIVPDSGYLGNTHVRIARSFNVLGDLTLTDVGSNYGPGYIDNPGSAMTITVSGDVNITGGAIGGTNLTINMIGASKTFNKTGGAYNSHLMLSGSDTSVYAIGSSFGATTSAFLIAGTNHTVTATAGLSMNFGTVSVNSGNTFVLGGNNLTAYTGTTVSNNGNMSGTATWDIQKDYYGGASSTVSAPAVWKVRANFVNAGAITHNNGTIIIGESSIGGGGTTTFDPGASDLYNLQLLAVSGSSSSYHYIGIARSFSVMADLTLGPTSCTWTGTINNPSSTMVINVSGNVSAGCINVNGTNLTINMIGSGKSLTALSSAANKFNAHIILAGSNTSFSSAASSFGDSTVTLTIAASASVTATSALTLRFGTVTNDGNFIGTATWDMSGGYYGGAGSTVSAPATWIVDKDFINAGAITHNNGTIIIGDTSVNGVTTTFDPGSSDLYNLQLAVMSSSNDQHKIIARSFNVLGDLTLGHATSTSYGYVDNPASPVTITVSGNVTHQYLQFGNGANLTVDMIGASKTLNSSYTGFKANITLSGSNTTFAMSGSYFGYTALGTTFKISGTGHTVTASSAITLRFDNVTIDSGNTFALGANNLTTYTSTTVTNNGNMTGTSGTWDMQKTYTSGASSTVSAPATWKVRWDFVNAGAITHNNGTIIIGDTNIGAYTTSFDPGSSDLYNLQLLAVSSSSSNYHHITIARSFNVLGSLTFGPASASYLGYVDNPASPVVINTYGGVAFQALRIGGNNLTITMVGGANQSISYTGSYQYSNLTINKTNGVASLATNYSVSTANQRVTISAGTLATAGYTLVLSGAGSVFSNNGTLRIQGGETLTFTRDTDSGVVEYVGNGATNYASLNYGNTYYSLNINSTSGTNSFTAAAATTVNGSFTLTSGTFVAPSAANLTVSRNFTHFGGNFTHNSGTVVLNTTNMAEVTGSTTYNNLTCSTGGKTINFGAGDTQTVVGTTTLNGSAGTLLTLRSNATPTQWRIDPQSTRSISYVDVKDSNNIAATPIGPSNSTNSYNNTNWFSYSVTASAGVNGNISPSGVSSYDSGSSPAYTITPDPTYHVADVLVDGVSVGSPTSYTFTSIAANHTISVSFAINTYTVTASAGSNGGISPNGVNTYNSGDSSTYTITPNANYHISDVTVDGSSVGALTEYTFTNITTNHTISASFAIDTYNITASAGSNGSINPVGVTTVNYADSQTYTITPDIGYNIVDVLVDGVSVGSVGSYEFTNVSTNHTITAIFTINTYTVTATAGSNGSITPSGGVVINYGTNQTFDITPNIGYHIADILVDGTSIGILASYEFTNVTANHTISASFAIDTKTITISAPSGNGTISPSGTITVNYGGNQTFTITPNSGYEVNDVLVDGASVGKITSYLMSNITTNHSISVVFALIPIIEPTPSVFITNPESETPAPTSQTTPTITTEDPSESATTSNNGDNTPSATTSNQTSGGKGPIAFISGVVSAVGNKFVEVMSTVSEKVVKVVKETPPPVAYSFPYFLFALLGIMILNFSIQTKREISQAMKLKSLLELEKNIAAEKDNFLMLSAHYLRTPLTLIKGAAEGLAFSKKLPTVIQSNLDTLVKHLSDAVESILQKVTNNSYLKKIESVATLQKKSIKTFSSAQFILPLVLIVVISVFANVLFVKVAKIDINYINYLAEIIVFVIVAQFFVLFFRTHQTERVNRQYFEEIYDHQVAIDDAKNSFIIESYRSLKADLDTMANIANSNNSELKVLNEGYRRIRDVVKKFGLAASVRSTGQQQASYQTIDTANLIAEILETKKSAIETKKLRIKIQNTAQIEQDKSKLAFVLNSILDNAIKFSKESGEVTVANQYNNSLLTVVVEDTGIGIPQDQMARLFKPFSRVGSALDFNYEGMGFSLYLSKLMMNSLGGDIAIESKPGLSTKVYVLFGQQAPPTAVKKAFDEPLPIAKTMAEML